MLDLWGHVFEAPGVVTPWVLTPTVTRLLRGYPVGADLDGYGNGYCLVMIVTSRLVRFNRNEL